MPEEFVFRDGQPGIDSSRRSLRQPREAQQVGAAGIGAQVIKIRQGFNDSEKDAAPGNRLPHGPGGRGHWLDMLGGSEVRFNASLRSRKTVACRQAICEAKRSPCDSQFPTTATQRGRALGKRV